MSDARAVVQTPGGAHYLRARRLGVDTQYEAVVFMHKDCPICRSEGFTAHNRLLLRAGERHIVATLYQITGDLVAHDEAALSESAWNRLDLKDGDFIAIGHPDPLESLSHVRSRIYGNGLSESALLAITTDIVDGKYSDIHLSSFITACAARPLDHREVLDLTKAMVDVGDRLSWNTELVLDKHSVGGLPGNRTTPIIVPIIAALVGETRIVFNVGRDRQLSTRLECPESRQAPALHGPHRWQLCSPAGRMDWKDLQKTWIILAHRSMGCGEAALVGITMCEVSLLKRDSAGRMSTLSRRSAGSLALYWRARHRPVRTEYATVAFQWLQSGSARATIIEEAACISWHQLNRAVTTFRTGQRRF